MKKSWKKINFHFFSWKKMNFHFFSWNKLINFFHEKKWKKWKKMKILKKIHFFSSKKSFFFHFSFFFQKKSFFFHFKFSFFFGFRKSQIKTLLMSNVFFQDVFSLLKVKKVKKWFFLSFFQFFLFFLSVFPKSEIKTLVMPSKDSARSTGYRRILFQNEKKRRRV